MRVLVNQKVNLSDLVDIPVFHLTNICLQTYARNMITLLSEIFIKKSATEAEKRTILGILCGIVGIVLNLCLFAGKFLAGMFSGAVSVTSDAFNNLSDAGSSIVTLLGFRIAAQKSDHEHPYGHGRMEYISALIVAAIIMVMGFELLKESIGKIITPAEPSYSLTVLIILIASIAIKLYMAFYNIHFGKQTGSVTLKATAVDSLSDCVATFVVLLSLLIHHFAGINVDGWAGVAVSCFILYSGFMSGKEAIDPLLGSPADPEFVREIEDIVTGFDDHIIGLHDLMVHDYGPGRRFISLHTEVPADGDILELHDIIDNLEKELSHRLNCFATIHMDPVNTKDPRVAELKAAVKELVRQIHPEITIHDFRVVFGESHSNLIFDMAVPYSCALSDHDVTRQARLLVSRELGSEYFCVIEVDREQFINH